jgi:hypothetical protein
MNARHMKCLSAACVMMCAAAMPFLHGTLHAASRTTPEGDANQWFLPLTPGTYWVYTGTVTSSSNESNAVQDVTTHVSITTKVEKVYQKPELTAAVISGYPGDLDWSNGQVEPKPSLLIETRKHEVFLNALPPDFDYAKLEKDAAALSKLMPEDNLLFRWPLKRGMKFGDAESVKREDDSYCWVVLEERRSKLESIKGLSPRTVDSFLLRYATNPDNTEMEISPGIGILSYEYHHHGTTADTSLHLVEFHAGQAVGASTGGGR